MLSTELKDTIYLKLHANYIIMIGATSFRKSVTTSCNYFSHQFSYGLQVGEKISVLDEFCDETEWLLHCHAPNECDHMWIIALGYLLHRLDLVEKVSSFTACSTGCNANKIVRKINTHKHTLRLYLLFSIFIATVTQILLFIVLLEGRGPLTTPLCTSPKHPSPNLVSTMTAPTGISHSSSSMSM